MQAWCWVSLGLSFCWYCMLCRWFGSSGTFSISPKDHAELQDINLKLCDMVRKANCLFATFPRVGPHILTRLFQSYCLSLYGSGLWSLSSTTLQNIEVAFNKILRRIWSLSPRSHFRIVHLVSNLHSLFNVIYRCSKSLLFAASQCPSLFARTVFYDSSLYCFSFCGYNMLGNRHIK